MEPSNWQGVFFKLCLCIPLLGWNQKTPGTAPTVSPEATQPSPTALVQQLEELVRTLREERQTFYQQHTSLTTRLDQARSTTQHWESQLQALEEQEAQITAESAALQDRIEADKNKLTQQMRVERSIGKHIRDFAQIQTAQIKSDPTPLQTNERCDGLRQATKAADPNHPLSAGGLSLLWQYIEQELTWTQSAQVLTARVKQADGSQPWVRFLRIGHLVLGILREDGDIGAWWDGQGAWQSATPIHLETLRNSIAILEGQQVPKRMPIPVPLRQAEGDR